MKDVKNNTENKQKKCNGMHQKYLRPCQTEIRDISGVLSIVQTQYQQQHQYMKFVGQVNAEGQYIGKADYINFIEEEFKELLEAVKNNDKVETLDALVDLLVVINGAAIQYGFDIESAYNEVIRNNFNRIKKDDKGNAVLQPDYLPDGSKNPKAGKVIKAFDSKPDLEKFIK
jgi:NTP pyrophosphatase (non-canonical NTP hydrolase)